jgi:hypothetical protein
MQIIAEVFGFWKITGGLNEAEWLEEGTEKLELDYVKIGGGDWKAGMDK